MSDVAYDINGNAIVYSDKVVGLRVKQLKPRGAPELQYNQDGCPLIVSPVGFHEELREALGPFLTTSTKFRLDPVGEDGKTIEDEPAAYVKIGKVERNADMGSARVGEPRVDPALAGLSQAIVEAVRLNSEALRQNAEIAMRAVDRLPQLMDAMTTALNVASGTGLHALQQRELVRAHDDDGDEGNDDVDDAAQAAGPTGFDINAVLGTALADIGRELIKKAPSLGAMLDPRKAYAEGQKERQAKQQAGAQAPTRPQTQQPATAQPAPAPTAAHRTASAAPRTATTAATASAPPITVDSPNRIADETANPLTDPRRLMHFLAIRNALGPAERELAEAIIEELPPAQRAAWLAELSALNVEDAVHRVRTTLVQLSQQAPPTSTSAPAQPTSIKEGASQ